MSKQNTAQIVYEEGAVELMDKLENLWNAQCDFHEEKSIHFSEKFRNLTFDYRKEAMKSDDNKVQIVVARDFQSDTFIGYVISTIDKEQVGELFSLYVDPSYRGLKIGDQLMDYGISWMESKGVKKIQLGVAVGNESVMKFYNRFDFYPYVVMMERKVD